MFDTLVLAAATKELEETIPGNRVQKIIQPTSTETVLQLYSSQSTRFLFISVHPSLARLHLTNMTLKQETDPPNFCMLLRKYLEGATISGIHQPEWERIAVIYLTRGSDSFKLVAEIMGRHSNLMLLNKEEKILGAIKHVTSEMSRYRVVVPGKSYFPPPTPQKRCPDDIDRETFKSEMITALQQGYSWEKALVSFLHGVSPLTAGEVVCRAKEKSSSTLEEGFIVALWEEIQEIVRCYHQGSFTPSIYTNERGHRVFSALDLISYNRENAEYYSSVNEMLDHYYREKYSTEKIKQEKENLYAILHKELKRVYQKEKKQEEDWKKAEKAEWYRLYGDLILSQMDQVPQGAEKVTLPNLYETNQPPVEIHLDPRLPPPANAERYFNKYRRAKKSRSHIKVQIKQTRQEASYLENVLYSLDNAGLEEIEEIREELIKTGYIKPKAEKKKPKTKKPQKSRPLSFTSSDGYQVLVGRNNTQNDEVTFKRARREDTWLHAQKIPGSHVVIKDAPFPPPENTLLEAASLAAYYSKNREVPRVTVDYTQIKHVKRAPGGKPGMVFYKNYKSVIVTPQSSPEEETASEPTR